MKTQEAWRKYLQNMYLIQDLSRMCEELLQLSTKKKINPVQMGNRPEWTPPERKPTWGQQVCEKAHWSEWPGRPNQNPSEPLLRLLEHSPHTENNRGHTVPTSLYRTVTRKNHIMDQKTSRSVCALAALKLQQKSLPGKCPNIWKWNNRLPHTQ